MENMLRGTDTAQHAPAFNDYAVRFRAPSIGEDVGQCYTELQAVHLLCKGPSVSTVQPTLKLLLLTGQHAM